MSPKRSTSPDTTDHAVKSKKQNNGHQSHDSLSTNGSSKMGTRKNLNDEDFALSLDIVRELQNHNNTDMNGAATNNNNNKKKKQPIARGKHKRTRSITNRSTMPLRPPSGASSLNTSSADEDDDEEEGNNNGDSKKSKKQDKQNSFSASSSTTSSLSVPAAMTRRGQKFSADCHIRPMTMSDIAPVYHLGNAIFTAADLPNMYRTWDDFAVVENFEGSPEFCFVAVSDQTQEIVGFLLGETMTKSSVGTRGYIQWVAVAPPYRRHGIAMRLLKHFTDAAQEQGISLLLADTPGDNTPAIHMFDKAGLIHTTDHVYLTRQIPKDLKIQHVEEDGSFHFTYTAKKQRITIRNMEIEDLHPIYLIGEQIFTQKSPNLYNFWDEHLVLQSYLSDPDFCVVATIKNEQKEEVVIGFAFGTTIEKPRSSWKYGYLVWLGCALEYQGLGLASQLYNVMLELFLQEKVRLLMIDTQQNNEGALKFFRKMGFGHDEEHIYLTNAPAPVMSATPNAPAVSNSSADSCAKDDENGNDNENDNERNMDAGDDDGHKEDKKDDE